MYKVVRNSGRRVKLPEPLFPNHFSRTIPEPDVNARTIPEPDATSRTIPEPYACFIIVDSGASRWTLATQTMSILHTNLRGRTLSVVLPGVHLTIFAIRKLSANARHHRHPPARPRDGAAPQHAPLMHAEPGSCDPRRASTLGAVGVEEEGGDVPHAAGDPDAPVPQPPAEDGDVALFGETKADAGRTRAARWHQNEGRTRAGRGQAPFHPQRGAHRGAIGSGRRRRCLVLLQCLGAAIVSWGHRPAIIDYGTLDAAQHRVGKARTFHRGGGG
eukprot:gene2404-biopygen9530